MPRSIVLGNDRLHVGFDMDYVLRDLYFPRVGQENHLARGPSRTGVWSNGRFAWAGDKDWHTEIRYMEDTLVSDVRFFHRSWKLEVVFNDCVDLDRAMLVRRVTINNLSAEEQDVRVFFHYAFQISGTGIGDTVLYDPDLRSLIAYKGAQYFLLGVKSGGNVGIEDWAAGIRDFNGKEGTWRDAEDGALSGNPVAQGTVDTTVGIRLGKVMPGGSATACQWLAAGDNKTQVKELDAMARERGPESFLDRTRDWWRAWTSKEPSEFGDLSESSQRLYRRSLLTIRTMLDSGGAIVASTDSDIIGYSRDTYAYCWPRDGALAAVALSKAGYGELSRRFFWFCQSVFEPFAGYFLHKYTPAGHLASTWHAWVGPDGQRQLPIQEDETGLVIYALWKHYEYYRPIEFIKPLYRPLVRAGADFIRDYVDPATRLPLPSYDLWEERWGVHAFTVGAAWAGLDAAARFAKIFRQDDISQSFAEAADAMKSAALTHFWDAQSGCFSRSLYPRHDGYERDTVLDASVLGLVLFGMLDPNDPRARSTVAVLQEKLWCKSDSGGIARYQNDLYQSDPKSGTPGNPWFVTTLWLAQYYAMAASSPDDLASARSLLEWAEDRAQATGLLPEQIHPQSGAPLSVSPLAWSHAEYVASVQAYVAAWQRLQQEPLKAAA